VEGKMKYVVICGLVLLFVVSVVVFCGPDGETSSGSKNIGSIPALGRDVKRIVDHEAGVVIYCTSKGHVWGVPMRDLFVENRRALRGGK
jgi:hypothetical protein